MKTAATAADFQRWESRARGMTDAALWHSARDCHAAAERMRGFDPIAEGRYDDEGFTYGDELRRRWRPAGATSEPVAILISVDGTPDGDFMVPFGHPSYTGKAGGETLLAQWQADDLLERGYRFA